jgi:hypothetical protein
MKSHLLASAMELSPFAFLVVRCPFITFCHYIGNYQSFLIKTLDVRGTSQRLITGLVVSVSVQRLLFRRVCRPISLEEATLKHKRKRNY